MADHSNDEFIHTTTLAQDPALIVNNVVAATNNVKDEQARDSNMSLENSIKLVNQFAFAYIIQILNPRRAFYRLTGVACPLRLEILWKNCPVQEKLLSYTSLWFSDRDNSWCSDNFPNTQRHTTTRKHAKVAEETALVKAAGAWSSDLEYDGAGNTQLSSDDSQTEEGTISSSTIKQTHNLLNGNEGQTTLSPYLSSNSESEIDSDRSPSEQSSERSQQFSVPAIKIDLQSLHLDESQGLPPGRDVYLCKDEPDSILPTRGCSGWTGTYRETPSAPGSSSAYSSNGNSAMSTGSIAGKRASSTGYSGPNQKRLRQGDENDGSGDESVPDNKNSKSMPLIDPSARLACHFHKLDQQKYCENLRHGKKYKTCAGGFKNSKDLRDHHKKKHCGPRYLCSRCHESFDSPLKKANHEKSRQRCEEHQNPTFFEEKVILTGTERRIAFDSMKKPRNTSHEKHWFDVWTTLFPDAPKPSSPYVPRESLETRLERIGELTISGYLQMQQTQALPRNMYTARSWLRGFLHCLQQNVRIDNSNEDGHQPQASPAIMRYEGQADPYSDLQENVTANLAAQGNASILQNRSFLQVPHQLAVPTAITSSSYPMNQDWMGLVNESPSPFDSQGQGFPPQGASNSRLNQMYNNYGNQLPNDYVPPPSRGYRNGSSYGS